MAVETSEPADLALSEIIEPKLSIVPVELPYTATLAADEAEASESEAKETPSL